MASRSCNSPSRWAQNQNEGPGQNLKLRCVGTNERRNRVIHTLGSDTIVVVLLKDVHDARREQVNTEEAHVATIRNTFTLQIGFRKFNRRLLGGLIQFVKLAVGLQGE
jgi:hypothetical protein